jgi:PAS domain S-box-containing protein
LYSALHAYALEQEAEVIERTSELDRERATLRTMLDGMAEGVLYREQEQYIYANRSLAQMLGCSIDDLLTSVGEIYAHFIVQPSDHRRMQADVDAVLAKNHVWRGEVRARRVDGSEFDAALSIAEVRSASNKVIGRVTLIRDVSQEKALQAQKNRFLTHAAHELRTPMSNIKMRLYLLRKQPEKQDIHLDVLDQVTNTMTNLIEDLLDLFRFQGNHIELHRQKLPLQTLLSEMVNSQQTEAERHEITLHADLPESSILVCIDRRRMGQALSNLVGHALNRTSPKGEVLIQVGVDHGQATICLGYTGADAENTADVFEPFFHATEGTDIRIGLGLSIAKEIITLHGGQILAGKQNDQPNGFRITLPVVDCPE